MRPFSTSLRTGTFLALLIPLSFTAACGDDEPSEGTGGSGGTSAAGGAGGSSASGGSAGSNGGTAGSSASGGTAGTGGSAGTAGIAGLGPARVELGDEGDLAAAGSYVLLAKMGITNVTGSRIDGGHVGLSPAAATFLTGFSLTADSSTTFSTSPSVVAPWKIFASNYGDPTPANLTSAVLSMEGAYTDAAGRSTPDFLNLGSGDIGGEILAPGLYTWGSTVTIPLDVTINGAANDVWIFQISDNLELSTNTSVLLAGGAQAKNIFWQVAGQVTIHAGAHFEGNILSQTGITLQTRASMVGRGLAQTLIALDDNAITAP